MGTYEDVGHYLITISFRLEMTTTTHSFLLSLLRTMRLANF